MLNRIKSLNVYNKFFSLTLIILAITFADNFYMVLSVSILGLILGFLIKDYDTIQLTIITIICLLFYYLHPFLLILVKLLLVTVYCKLLKSMLDVKEQKYLVERLTYKREKDKAISSYVKNCYLKDLFNHNLKVYDKISLWIRRRYVKYIIRQTEIKTNYDMQDLMITSRFRFYRYYKKKNSTLKLGWNKDDNTLILISVLVFILTILYR